MEQSWLEPPSASLRQLLAWTEADATALPELYQLVEHADLEQLAMEIESSCESTPPRCARGVVFSGGPGKRAPNQLGGLLGPEERRRPHLPSSRVTSNGAEFGRNSTLSRTFHVLYWVRQYGPDFKVEESRTRKYHRTGAGGRRAGDGSTKLADCRGSRERDQDPRHIAHRSRPGAHAAPPFPDRSHRSLHAPCNSTPPASCCLHEPSAFASFLFLQPPATSRVHTEAPRLSLSSFP